MAAAQSTLVGDRVLTDVVSIAINNRITTFVLNKPLELDKVKVIFDSVKQSYTVTENGFTSLSLRFEGAHTSIFESGKVVCTHKEPRAAYHCVSRFIWLLRNNNYRNEICIVRSYVRNIVGSVKFDLIFDLDKLINVISNDAHRQNLNAPLYDINQSPCIQWELVDINAPLCDMNRSSGVQFELADVNATYLIFQSGEVVITNCKTDKDIQNAAVFIHCIIQKCRTECPGSVLQK